MKKVLVLLDNSFVSDNRVERELDSLRDHGFEAQLVCLKSDYLPPEEKSNGYLVKRILPNDLLKPFIFNFSTYIEQLDRQTELKSFDFIHCHDFHMLFFGVAIKKRFPHLKLIYDAHEYLPGWPYYQDSIGVLNRLKGRVVYNFYCLREAYCLKFIDAYITVSQSLLNLRTELKSSVEKVVLRNLPTLPINNDKIDIREQFKIANDKFVFLFSGHVYLSNQQLIAIRNAFKNCANAVLVFVVNDKSCNKLEQIFDFDGRLFFRVDYPSSYHDLCKIIRSCDVGLVLTYRPDWPSHWFSLPNRLGEYLVNKTPVLATNQPEFEKIISELNVGVCYSPTEPDGFENAIQHVINNYSIIKENLSQISEQFIWNSESPKLISLYKALL